MGFELSYCTCKACIESYLLGDDKKCDPKEMLSLNISFHNNKSINLYVLRNIQFG